MDFLDNKVSFCGPVVATVGFFDGVHRGHQHLVHQVVDLAHAKGMESVVITFDKHPRQVLDTSFTPLLLATNTEKMERLKSAGADHCLMLHFTKELAALSAYDFMRMVLRDQLGVKCLVIGYDNRFGHNRSDGFEDYVRFGSQLGMEVVEGSFFSVDDIKVSSSVIRKKLLEGNIEEANRCLGYPYGFKGTVVAGYKVGRLLGFPTANIHIDDENKMIPANGVYAARVVAEGSPASRLAVLNIGLRPTFNGHERTIEVHLMDFDGDLYGRHLQIELVAFLREECKFDSPSMLSNQMREDVEKARQLFNTMKEK